MSSSACEYSSLLVWKTGLGWSEEAEGRSGTLVEILNLLGVHGRELVSLLPIPHAEGDLDRNGEPIYPYEAVFERPRR
jgi:hypothetical protein